MCPASRPGPQRSCCCRSLSQAGGWKRVWTLGSMPPSPAGSCCWHSCSLCSQAVAAAAAAGPEPAPRAAASVPAISTPTDVLIWQLVLPGAGTGAAAASAPALARSAGCSSALRLGPERTAGDEGLLQQDQHAPAGLPLLHSLPCEQHLHPHGCTSGNLAGVHSATMDVQGTGDGHGIRLRTSFFSVPESCHW